MSSKYFENRQCEYYPCHNGAEHINCLFCFCPLYLKECGGNYVILPSGTKDCSGCLFPHKAENYEKIIKKLSDNK